MGTHLLGPTLAVALSLTSVARAAEPVVIQLPPPSATAAPNAPAPAPTAPATPMVSVNGGQVSVVKPAKVDPWKAYPLALEGHAAFASPLGGFGLALDLSVAQLLAINGGIGVGFGGRFSDMQLALTPRVRFPLNDGTSGVRAALGIEAGISRGGHTEIFGCILESNCANKSWEWVVWQNTNLEFEIRSDHFQIRFFLGRGTPVASKGRAYCETSKQGGDCVAAATRLPSAVANFGLAIGYAF